MGERDQKETEARAELDWKEDLIPVSTRFDDPYFSLAGGLEETRYVFLAGNDLPARFTPGFQIAELGFGTGLNLLATLIAWRTAGIAAPLRFISFEAFPMQAEEMAGALRAFPEAEAVAGPVLDQWADGARRITLSDLDLQVVIGDARETLPGWEGRADAWYLDGFSPAKNPELWSESLMAEVAAHTAPSGSFATYAAAGFVRRGLQAAGFQTERVTGYAGKRHMSRGMLDIR